ncbi:MAG: uncharacterized protein JWM36_3699 [Hyphomicrobiales bacterium]|nr:uncharacterized protein [Hyphomicrobiales bacterium]
MKWIVAAVGLLLVIAGAIAIQDGISIIQVERGWAGVISGTVALSAGVIVLGVAAVLAQLDRIATLLAEAAFATPIAESAPEPSVAPDSPVVGSGPRTLRSMLRSAMHKQEQVDEAPLTPVPPMPLDVAVEPLPVRTDELVGDSEPAPVTRAAPAWPSEQATSFADRLKQMKDKREESRDRPAYDKPDPAADTKAPRDFHFKFPPIAPRFGGDPPQPERVVPLPVELRGTLHQESSESLPVSAAEPELSVMEEVAQPVTETVILEQVTTELEPVHVALPPDETPAEQPRQSPLFNPPWRTPQKAPAAPETSDDLQGKPEPAKDDDEEGARLGNDERSLEELEAMVAELEAQAAGLQDVEAADEQKAFQAQEHLTEENDRPEPPPEPEPAKPEQSWPRPVVPEPPLAPIGSADWLERALSGVDEEPAPPPFVPKMASRFAPEAQPAPPLVETPPRVEIAEEPTVIGRYQTDGTAYVMYSDGSIDAETDRGAFRFGSLAELKAFIERSA